MEKNKNISGRIWLLGDHVNTDLIHPPSCFSLDPAEMKKGLRISMERLKTPAMLKDVREKPVIVAGENFGCGSSRETSVRALFAIGVRAVVAKSFARIFYRSLVNRGIAPIVCKAVYSQVTNGDRIRISMEERSIILNDSAQIPFGPFDPHIEKILACGGLMNYLKEEQEQN